MKSSPATSDAKCWDSNGHIFNLLIWKLLHGNREITSNTLILSSRVKRPTRLTTAMMLRVGRLQRAATDLKRTEYEAWRNPFAGAWIYNDKRSERASSHERDRLRRLSITTCPHTQRLSRAISQKRENMQYMMLESTSNSCTLSSGGKYHGLGWKKVHYCYVLALSSSYVHYPTQQLFSCSSPVNSENGFGRGGRWHSRGRTLPGSRWRAALYWCSFGPRCLFCPGWTHSRTMVACGGRTHCCTETSTSPGTGSQTAAWAAWHRRRSLYFSPLKLQKFKGICGSEESVTEHRPASSPAEGAKSISPNSLMWKTGWTAPSKRRRTQRGRRTHTQPRRSWNCSCSSKKSTMPSRMSG